jgi:hypothetical protein
MWGRRRFARIHIITPFKYLLRLSGTDDVGVDVNWPPHKVPISTGHYRVHQL